jgi:hypothetical protein
MQVPDWQVALLPHGVPGGQRPQSSRQLRPELFAPHTSPKLHAPSPQRAAWQRPQSALQFNPTLFSAQNSPA